ncbi:MAG TPA: sugar transferase, partial [Terriglobales bacterium]|nr:sugar transferase [Terriglobales bacterium]
MDRNLHVRKRHSARSIRIIMKIGGQRIPGLTLLLIASESVLIGFSLVLATALRLADRYLLLATLGDSSALLRFGIVVVVCVVALYYYDLYDLQLVSRRSELFVRLLQALGVACLFLALLYYAAPDLSLGRGVAAVAAPLIIALVLGWRLLVDASAPVFRNLERVLILGTGPAAMTLAQEILLRPELNLRLVGLLDESEPRNQRSEPAERGQWRGISLPLPAYHPGRDLERRSDASVGVAAAPAREGIEVAMIEPLCPSIIGLVSQVEQITVAEHVDRVVLAFSERRATMPVTALLHLKFLGVKIEEVQDAYERISGRILLDHLAPSWFILSDGFRKPPTLLAMKRIVDVVAALIAVVVFAPVMLLVAAAILLETGTPVLFQQERVGQNGRVFRILKFRSMRNDNGEQKARWTADVDSRITRVGRFIRKFRLDELPQFVNVLRGDMSLVGPRPEQPALVDML